MADIDVSKIKLPGDNNDYILKDATARADAPKVTQTITTTNAKYRVLMSKSANDTTETDTTRKSANLYFNPASCQLSATCDSDSLARIQVCNSDESSAIYMEHGLDNGKSIGWHDGQYMYPILHIDSSNVITLGNIMKSTLIDLFYPVGSIYISVNDTNPGTYLTDTTWVAWGAGRVPVGVDSSSDFKTVEKTGGSKTVTLTGAQSGVQAHNHTIQANVTTVEASGYSLVNNSSGGFVNRVIINTTNPKSTTLVENVAAKNATSAHTNLQPYITCYMWKRTA